MSYTKKVFVEITTLEPISDELIYNALHHNIKSSFIVIHCINKITYRDV